MQNDLFSLLTNKERLARWGSYLLILLSFWIILHFSLLSAFLAGMTVHFLTIKGASFLPVQSHGRARGILVGGLSVFIVILLMWLGLSIHSFLSYSSSNLGLILDKSNEILSSAKLQLPHFIAQTIPSNMGVVLHGFQVNIESHSSEIQGVGKAALTNMAHILIGLILGGIIALSELHRQNEEKPLTKALKDRANRLSFIFGQIVSAQFKISLINTLFTAVFLWIFLPLIGYHLPLSKTLVLLTFILGLLPVIGNLLSNTLVILVSLTVGPWIAFSSLIFLILIHKLEYFLNAKIVGSQIQAKAWELLLAMLVMEALFGLPGVIVAPIFYAYIKKELMERNWI